jgi:hypothetical protein
MKKILIFITFLFYVSILFSQEALKSTEEDYYDFLALDGITERPTLGYRTLSDSVWEINPEKSHIWENNNLGKQNVLWESENQGKNWFSKGYFHGTKIKIFSFAFVHDEIHIHLDLGFEEGDDEIISSFISLWN